MPVAPTIRSLGPDELELFLSFGGELEPGRFRAEWEGGNRRASWTWVALREGRVIARAAWWGAAGAARPAVLDVFEPGGEPDRLAAGEALLRACWPAEGEDLECELFLPPDWRDDPAVRRSVEERLEVARRAGLVLLVERHRFEWTPERGVPPRGTRLAFHSVAATGEAAFTDALARSYAGSLDVHTRRQLARGADPGELAAADAALLRSFPSPAEWWRLAFTPTGQLVGLVVPARNEDGPIIAYLGVVPEQRGHGYARDLLAEATALLAGQGAERIRADTDQENVPMAATFERCGYRRFATRIDLVRPD